MPNPDARPRRTAAASDDAMWPSPGGRDSGPYAIAMVDDVIWYVESAASPNMLTRFDPKNQKFEQWPIPSGGGVVRNMASAPNGGLALACSGVNAIALVEITKRAQ